MPEATPRGIAFLDVDGVIFRGQFLIRMARRKGVRSFLRTVGDSLLFEMGRLTTERFLRRTYRRLRKLSWNGVQQCYARAPLMPGAKETVAQLKAHRMMVILLSSGVPDPIVKDLARQVGADDGVGCIAQVRDGRLTGRVGGEMTRHDGKLRYAERIVAKFGMRWQDVCAIGDDRNNLPLLTRAGTGIGFHATTAVRRQVECLVDDENLTATLPFALPERRLGRALAEQTLPERRPWLREIMRKLVHLVVAVGPLLALRLPEREAISAMPAALIAPGRTIAVSLAALACLAAYIAAECFRLYGQEWRWMRHIERLIMRRRERRELAEAPLALAAGALTALWCFPAPIGLSCVLIAGVGDSVASVVGSQWGRVAWWHNPLKTVEGTLACLAAATACALVYLPLPSALMLGAVAAAMESFPLRDWDNFLTPVGTGLIATILIGGKLA